MKIQSFIRNAIFSLISFIRNLNSSETDKADILVANLIIDTNNSKIIINNLQDVEFSVSSQWGEDGIIQWLVDKIPNLPNSFIEFGVENYLESNTRLLLIQRNWSGLVLDGSSSNINNIMNQDIYWRYNLIAKHAFVNSENINDLILNAGFNDEIGILSIDIDGNDYWVWDAITVVNPVLVVCEYNAVLGDLLPLTIPYSADFIRSKAHYSNLYFGASIQALIILAKRKGYTFIGTTSTGANAFFIKETYAHSITSLLKNVSAYPSKFREARDEKGDLQFTSGIYRKEIIKDLPFLNLNTGKVGPLSSFGEIYSSSWQKGESVNF